jgi:hypothetical protein
VTVLVEHIVTDFGNDIIGFLRENGLRKVDEYSSLNVDKDLITMRFHCAAPTNFWLLMEHP